jgi:zinc transporter 1/2/3
MFSVFIVVALEMFLTTRGARHSHSHGGDWEEILDEDEEHSHHAQHPLQPMPNGHLAPPRKTHGRLGKLGMNHRPENISVGDLDASEGLVAGVSPFAVSTPVSNGHVTKPSSDEEDDEDSDIDIDFNELTPRPIPEQDIEPQAPSKNLTPEEEQKRQILQCFLLEAGILFHSIFIGMAISVATGPPFVVFLVAIAFHQSFEGLALGSRIAAINFPARSARPWLMVLAYGATTPIGQAIGLIVHNLYDPQSAAGLLMVGFMNAISSGLLVFAGLVQLLAEDFLSDKSYGVLKGRRRWEAFGAMLAGATLMALVGAWA